LDIQNLIALRTAELKQIPSEWKKIVSQDFFVNFSKTNCSANGRPGRETKTVHWERKWYNKREWISVTYIKSAVPYLLRLAGESLSLRGTVRIEREGKIEE